MSFHLHTEDFTFLQIYHSATNYAVFFKRHAPPERPAICKSLYLVTDLLGLRNSLTKQVGEHKNFWALLFHLWSFSFYQKLAANLHSFMIISQSFAGANNNEKQDLNRSTGIQFSVHMPLPPHIQLSCRSSPQQSALWTFFSRANHSDVQSWLHSFPSVGRNWYAKGEGSKGNEEVGHEYSKGPRKCLSQDLSLIPETQGESLAWLL